MSNDIDATAIDSDFGCVDYIFEVGHLKNLPRAGWAFIGVKSAETVAEHSHRVGVISYVLAASIEEYPI